MFGWLTNWRNWMMEKFEEIYSFLLFFNNGESPWELNFHSQSLISARILTRLCSGNFPAFFDFSLSRPPSSHSQSFVPCQIKHFFLLPTQEGNLSTSSLIYYTGRMHVNKHEICVFKTGEIAQHGRKRERRASALEKCQKASWNKR